MQYRFGRVTAASKPSSGYVIGMIVLGIAISFVAVEFGPGFLP